jgi:peptidoglycan/xylan/chitin deacetylase (PgdA/CDA1 family)
MRPKTEWPDGKKICATFTVAFEAFTRGGHFKKAKGLEVNLVSLSHANYGGNAGIWRILEILERNKARATVDVNGLAVQKWPDAVKALHAAGNEIAGHGTTNDIKMTDLTPVEQRAEIRAVNRIVTEVIGEQPVGWVSPGGHHTRETLGILADEGYTWCGDQCDDDLPYVVEVDGKRMVIVPKHWFFNDWRAWNGGASNGEMAFQGFKDGFDFVLEEALRGKPGRVDALVHTWSPIRPRGETSRRTNLRGGNHAVCPDDRRRQRHRGRHRALPGWAGLERGGYGHQPRSGTTGGYGSRRAARAGVAARRHRRRASQGDGAADRRRARPHRRAR